MELTLNFDLFARSLDQIIFFGIQRTFCNPGYAVFRAD